MKKVVLAAAVAGAFAASAQAQNVTIYGAVDTGLQIYDRTAESFNRAANDQNTTSRIGLKTSEDLGGGLKAGAVIQGTLTADQSTSFAFNEESNVYLSGSFGTVSFGKQDLTGGQGVDTTVGMGNFFNAPTVGATVTVASGELGKDLDSTFRYTSPTVNGFTLQVGLSQNNSSAVADGNAESTGVFASYVNGPLAVYAGTAKTDGVGNAKKDHNVFAGSYDFGMANVGVVMGQGDASADSNTADTKYSVISVKVPLGNGLTAAVARANASIENSDDKGQGTKLVLKKDLSKRTSVYAYWVDTEVKGGAYFAWGGTTANATYGNTNASATGVGFSHAF